MGTRRIGVFMAAPGDLAVERRSFRDQIKALNAGFGDGAGISFEALGWEDTLAVAGRRPQNLINSEIDSCDVFVLAFYRRWGQPAPDAHPYASYTEEEFHRALDRFQKTGVPEIFVFFKTVDAASMADPGPELTKVLRFRRELEATRLVLYRMFGDETSFCKELDLHLRAYVKGDLPHPDSTRTVIVLPLEYIREVERAEADARAQAQRAEAANERAEAEALRAKTLTLELVRLAAEHANAGRVEEARQRFAASASDANSVPALSLAVEFYEGTEDWAEAEVVVQRWLAISGRDSITADTARAYRHLGQIRRARKRLDDAERMFRRALTIYKRVQHLEGAASTYENLMLVFRERGDSAGAQEMHRKRAEIDEEIAARRSLANSRSRGQAG